MYSLQLNTGLNIPGYIVADSIALNMFAFECRAINIDDVADARKNYENTRFTTRKNGTILALK